MLHANAHTVRQPQHIWRCKHYDYNHHDIKGDWYFQVVEGVKNTADRMSDLIQPSSQF